MNDANPQGPVRVVPVEPTPEILLELAALTVRRIGGVSQIKSEAQLRDAWEQILAAVPDHIGDANEMVAAAPEGVEGWRCPKCGAAEDERHACCEAFAETAVASGWQSMVSAPRTVGLVFEARCGDYAPVDAYWNGSIHVHCDPDDGEIAYLFTHWRPLPAIADGGR